ncbi:ABC transporter ATP-binding protein [Barrientosiimonas marina]|uniref:ABC transporter ATP-binding protein n=1 Tax=Lentibacillus kimchii TaxID=1542911 RepID=A0ABW2UT92_9BACI
MAETAMALDGVSKTIRNKTIISDLTFAIDKGEVFGFIGPNGAGKTTTIRMMVGLMKISDGDIRILGKSIKSDFKEAIQGIGAIVENPELYPFMSGWKNLKHFARMIPGITDERILEVVRLLGMEKPINEKVGRYSLGMRQRLGIAQALLHEPSVLILDEPTNGLDPAGMREIRQYIRRLAVEENVAVIISSHLLSEIELICDRIGIIKNGELVTTQSVHDNSDQQLSKIQLEAAPAERAIQLLKSQHDIDASDQDGSVAFKCEKETIPALVKTLTEQDIAIYQIKTANETLEDTFFDVIGANTIE